MLLRRAGLTASAGFSCLHTYYTFLSTLDYKLFIELSQTLTKKLCHIKHDYLVHEICSKMSTIGRNARVQTFAKVVRLICFVDRYLWQVIADLLLL